MTGKRVLLRHEVKRGGQRFLRHFPSDERAVRKLGGKQRLPHPADHAGFDHRPDPLDHDLQRHPGFLRDHVERLALETGDEVLGDGQDGCVDGLGVFDRDGGIHGGKQGLRRRFQRLAT